MKKVQLATLILGLLILGGASYWWNRWQTHDLAHDSPTVSSAQPAQSRAAADPYRHPPQWHHGLIHGTKGDDVLIGTEGSERIEALAGQDQVDARGGDDVLDGGDGADTLRGGPGNDTYIVQHHGGGSDRILEEGGTDQLQFVGRISLSSIEVLRHGDDLLIRWHHEQPADAILIRSWFLGAQYHVERLQFTDGKSVALAPLAERAQEASSEDVIHFPPAK